MYDDYSSNKLMTNFILDKVAPPVFFLVVGFAAISSLLHWIMDPIQATDELQTILKNECGMEYSTQEVRRNGKNLSRICGLKKN
ncbi:hypothetical protein CC030809_00223 [Synechococcus phage S-CAM7]|uniref:Uncharacterized protein n=2 Tax=Synechococcus phage S-CAM7 TaxID=1883368 RepID=A0A7D5KUL4_9CAUD|nr:hypothetical protein CC030809_00223 [Synechococcus phage S-CAM7]